MLGGLGILILALLNLALFFGLDGHQANEVGFPKMFLSFNLFVHKKLNAESDLSLHSSNNLAPFISTLSLSPSRYAAESPSKCLLFYFRFRSSIRMLRIFFHFLTRLKSADFLLPVKTINRRCGVSRPCFDLECYC